MYTHHLIIIIIICISVINICVVLHITNAFLVPLCICTIMYMYYYVYVSWCILWMLASPQSHVTWNAFVMCNTTHISSFSRVYIFFLAQRTCAVHTEKKLCISFFVGFFFFSDPARTRALLRHCTKRMCAARAHTHRVLAYLMYTPYVYSGYVCVGQGTDTRRMSHIYIIYVYTVGMCAVDMEKEVRSKALECLKSALARLESER